MIAVDYAHATATAVQLWLGASLLFLIFLLIFAFDEGRRPPRRARPSRPVAPTPIRDAGGRNHEPPEAA